MHNGLRHPAVVGAFDAERCGNEDEILRDVRRALQRREMDEARATFLQLPLALATGDRAPQKTPYAWLESVLRDGYTAGLFDIQAILSFLESLPSWEWTLDGCCVLHHVNVTLETSSLHLVHLPTLPLAYFLHKLMNHLDGSMKIRAESYWFEWVSPAMRAIVTGQPLRLASVPRDELLYAPVSDFAFDFDRRNVFTWRRGWTEDERKDQWRLIPANAQRDRFYLQSVNYNEYLYAADYAKFRRDERGNTRSRVFGWRRRDDPVGDAGHWQLIQLDPTQRDVFALYNPYQKEYLYSPPDVYDRDRRYVLTMPYNPKDPAWLEQRKWRVLPIAYPPMERGIEAFFMKRYPEAVELLTLALAELPDHSEHVKCFVYRMTANVRMGKAELILEDFQAIGRIGGDKAAIFHGLHHLWVECATVLAKGNGDFGGTGDEEDAQGTALPALDPSLASTISPLMILQHHITFADQFFVKRQYESALATYQEAAAMEIGSSDPMLWGMQIYAHVAAVKCHFALDQIQAAIELIQELIQKANIPTETISHLLLWLAKCQRRQRDYDEALKSLEMALDRLSSQTEASHPWLRQGLLNEMKVVAIYRRELHEQLLGYANGNDQDINDSRRRSEKIIQEMMDQFHCPLSLELMQDPVMTPNGDTYEREMIERHLEVNGSFDPMTRSPLTKAQLYPNRALKVLMETLLSEHRLGLLLASCAS